VEEVEGEIEQGAGGDLAVDQDVLLVQVPSTGAILEGRRGVSLMQSPSTPWYWA
jgi:hypothetical protein